MNNIFIVVLGIYMLIFLAIGIRDIKSVKGIGDYAVAGKRQGSVTVTMTLLATALGASTTIGIADTIYSIGFPGIWWLAFGAVGLVLQSVFLSERVRETGADTLPQLAEITVGRAAGWLLALVIVISWIGVIAGQFAAINSIITFATGGGDDRLFMIVAAIAIIYTVVGGQISVVKTDKIQLIMIIAALTAGFIYLYFVKGGNTAQVMGNIELCNDNYRPINLFTQFFVIGGVYFLGPDIISRNFLSGNEKAAKRSALAAGLALFGFSIIITFIGMWVRYNVTADQLGDSKALMYVINILPPYIGILLALGLLSAVLSSADTCLVNASSIFVKDILKKDSVAATRVTAAVIGVIAALLAIGGRGDIMALLTGAYSIYTPGVIFPLTVAIFAYGRFDIKKPLWLAAVVLGGIVGAAGSYLTDIIPAAIQPYTVLIGMGISLVLSLLSVTGGMK